MVDVPLSDSSGSGFSDGLGGVILVAGPQIAPPAYVPRSQEDVAAAMLAALPRGRVWPKRDGSNLWAGIGAMAMSYVRIYERCGDLLQEQPAGSLSELLPEWEATLGLPDPCAGANPTVQQRQQSVLAQIAARGGQSIAYFQLVGAALGIAITIEEFAPPRAGFARAGGRAYDPGVIYTWLVHAPAWVSQLLFCNLKRRSPAHATLMMAYAGGNPVTDEFGVALTDENGVIVLEPPP